MNHGECNRHYCIANLTNCMRLKACRTEPGFSATNPIDGVSDVSAVVMNIPNERGKLIDPAYKLTHKLIQTL